MIKDSLKTGYTLYGYEIISDLVVVYSYSNEPIEQDATFGFMWHAIIDGVRHEGAINAYENEYHPTEKAKREVFELVAIKAMQAVHKLLNII